jgi:lipopolysaccharide transport system ATP-binding protein
MNVRLGFAVAAHLEPEILIVDEVLAVGDAEFQKKAIGKMEDVSKGEGRTILFVSHNMGAIKNLCDNSIWMNNGIVQEYGKTNHIIENYLNQTILGKDNAFTKFEIDEKKDFQVESVKLKNTKNDLTRDFECDDDIIIEINCISRKPVPGLYGYLNISNQDQLPMIVFDSMEYNSNNPLDSLSIGNHTFKIIIPSRCLGVGTYLLYLNFTSHLNPAGFTVDSPKEICTFNLTDSTTIRGLNREALLSLVLDWKKIV